MMDWQRRLWMIFTISLTESMLVSGFIRRPRNTFVMAGGQIRLDCETAGDKVSWKEYTSGTQGSYVSVGTEIVHESRAAKYSIAHKSYGQYQLVITGVRLENAGRYRCTSLGHHSKMAEAEVVVIGSDPNCGYRGIGSDEDFVDGDLVLFSCTVAYRGFRAPIMQWAQLIGKTKMAVLTSVKNVTMPTNVTYSVSKYLHLEDTGHPFTCRVYFPNDVDLTPVYNFRYSQRRLLVHPTNSCESNPCRNDGTCVFNKTEFTCICPESFSGRICQQDVNECLHTPCTGHAICLNKYGSYSCECDVGFIGTRCETEIDVCSSEPCANLGICTAAGFSYSCSCASGFVGANCETGIDQCVSVLCQNGGVCVIIEKARCVCPAGFDGTYCEHDIDECLSTPCQNGGVCSDGEGSFFCACPAKFTGNECQFATKVRLLSLVKDPCLSHPCEHGGTCIVQNGVFHCRCTEIYSGKTCQELQRFSRSTMPWIFAMMSCVIPIAVFLWCCMRIVVRSMRSREDTHKDSLQRYENNRYKYSTNIEKHSLLGRRRHNRRRRKRLTSQERKQRRKLVRSRGTNRTVSEQDVVPVYVADTQARKRHRSRRRSSENESATSHMTRTYSTDTGHETKSSRAEKESRDESATSSDVQDSSGIHGDNSRHEIPVKYDYLSAAEKEAGNSAFHPFSRSQQMPSSALHDASKCPNPNDANSAFSLGYQALSYSSSSIPPPRTLDPIIPTSRAGSAKGAWVSLPTPTERPIGQVYLPQSHLQAGYQSGLGYLSSGPITQLPIDWTGAARQGQKVVEQKISTPDWVREKMPGLPISEYELSKHDTNRVLHRSNDKLKPPSRYTELPQYRPANSWIYTWPDPYFNAITE